MNNTSSVLTTVVYFSNTTNNTALPVWSNVPAFLVGCTVTAVITNTGVLALFFATNDIQTPFNWLLIVLLISNNVNAIVVGPLDILNFLYKHWPFGRHVCTLYIFSSWTMQAFVPHVHILISLNRLWAVLRPVNYRHHAGPRVVWISLVVVTIYICLLAYPILITDLLYYRKPEFENGCAVNFQAQGVYGHFVQWLVYNGPVFVVALVYPAVAGKTFIRHIRRGRLVVQVPSLNKGQPSSDSGRAGEDPEQSVAQRAILSSAAEERKRARNTKSFALLTWLTLSMVILWTPLHAYYSATLYMDNVPQMFFEVGAIMFFMQAIVDPLSMLISYRDLRVKLLSWIPRFRHRGTLALPAD